MAEVCQLLPSLNPQIKLTRSVEFIQLKKSIDVSKDNRAFVYFDRDKLEFVGIDETLLIHLVNIYPGVDIHSELKKMVAWLGFSEEGKKRTGNINFIMNWLNKSKPTLQTELSLAESPLCSHLQDYLKDLWKNREHILEMNSIKH